MALQVTSTNEEKVLITLNPVTAAGNPAGVENLDVVVVDGDATTEVVEANKSFYVISGSGGLSNITVTADGDLGAGVVTLTDTIEYFVTAATATSFGLTAGTPELK